MDVNAYLIAKGRGISVTTAYVRAGVDLVPAIQTRVVTNSGEYLISAAASGAKKRWR